MNTSLVRTEVMVWWLLLLPISLAALCRPGHQYWSDSLEACVNCTKCPQVGHVVLRPCQVHQDTVCGPISALDIDWSFLGRSHRRTSSSEDSYWSSSEETDESKPRRKHKKWPKHHKHNHKKHNKTRSHQHHHHKKLEWSSREFHSFELPDRSNSSEREETVRWSSSSRAAVHKLKQVPESASQLKENLTVEAPVTEAQFRDSEPFSAAEELVWDWQAVALALAVFACLLFFLVACVYSVHHARQWRRLKNHFDDFEADVGELSTRLSLLLPAIQDGGSPVNADCCSNPSQCLYLEKLLARKHQEEEKGDCGNVYIDRDVAKTVIVDK